jgi:hypothetical protein
MKLLLVKHVYVKQQGFFNVWNKTESYNPFHMRNKQTEQIYQYVW